VSGGTAGAPRRVLLTGATGFIGSHVARRLVQAGNEVIALVRPGADLRRIADLTGQLRLLEGDLFTPGSWETAIQGDAAPDLCLHLAWYAVPGKYLRAPENLDCVTASLRLLRLLDAAGCARVVSAGTCFEYDTDAGYLTENGPLLPRTLYAAAKHGFFQIAEQFQKERGRSFAHARLFYQYGPWEDVRRLVPHVITHLLRGESCALTSGEQVRDFLHVEDVASALCALGASDVRGAVNIGSSQPIMVADIARSLGVLVGRPDLVHLGARETPPGDPPFICANTNRLRAEVGWRPAYDLQTGLEETIAWWRNHVAV